MSYLQMNRESFSRNAPWRSVSGKRLSSDDEEDIERVSKRSENLFPEAFVFQIITPTLWKRLTHAASSVRQKYATIDARCIKRASEIRRDWRTLHQACVRNARNAAATIANKKIPVDYHTDTMEAIDARCIKRASEIRDDWRTLHQACVRNTSRLTHAASSVRQKCVNVQIKLLIWTFWRKTSLRGSEPSLPCQISQRRKGKSFQKIKENPRPWKRKYKALEKKIQGLGKKIQGLGKKNTRKKY